MVRAMRLHACQTSIASCRRRCSATATSTTAQLVGFSCFCALLRGMACVQSPGVPSITLTY